LGLILLKQVRRVVSDPAGERIPHEELEAVGYLEAVLWETLRLYPRQATKHRHKTDTTPVSGPP
jgi:cytochrome P450